MTQLANIHTVKSLMTKIDIPYKTAYDYFDNNDCAWVFTNYEDFMHQLSVIVEDGLFVAGLAVNEESVSYSVRKVLKELLLITDRNNEVK